MATMGKPLVLKIGGNQIDDDQFLAGLAGAVSELVRSQPVVLVHGGGKEIGDLHERLGVSFTKIAGLRVTTPESMQLVEMVLNGSVNTRLVRLLVNAGVPAVGLSGVDFGLLKVRRMQVDGVDGQDLGLVGEVQSVNAGPLLALLAAGLTPVISPVSLGEDGLAYNVNADQAATAVARGLGSPRLVFVTNVPGVQVAGRTARSLTVQQTEELIAEGVVSGGMIPKVRAASDAARSGVHQAVITDLAGLAQDGGTAVLKG